MPICFSDLNKTSNLYLHPGRSHSSPLLYWGVPYIPDRSNAEHKFPNCIDDDTAHYYYTYYQLLYRIRPMNLFFHLILGDQARYIYNYIQLCFRHFVHSQTLPPFIMLCIPGSLLFYLFQRPSTLCIIDTET